MSFLGIVAVFFGVALISLAFAFVFVARRHRRTRHMEREAAVRTVLFRTLQEPDRSDEFVGGLIPSDGPILEAKARTLLADLKGEDRETLARLLEPRCGGSRPTPVQEPPGGVEIGRLPAVG